MGVWPVGLFGVWPVAHPMTEARRIRLFMDATPMWRRHAYPLDPEDAELEGLEEKREGPDLAVMLANIQGGAQHVVRLEGPLHGDVQLVAHCIGLFMEQAEKDEIKWSTGAVRMWRDEERGSVMKFDWNPIRVSNMRVEEAEEARVEELD